MTNLEKILGVENDQEFCFAEYEKSEDAIKYRIHNGRRQSYNILSRAWVECYNEESLTYIINNPDSIKRIKTEKDDIPIIQMDSDPNEPEEGDPYGSRLAMILRRQKMRKVSLEEIKNGEQFALDGVEFVKLDDDDGATFVVTADVILECVPFDSERETERNNFVGSEIESALLEWLNVHPGIEEAVVERPIDLTSMDGMKDYGKPVVMVRLLTIDEYRRYRSLIPLASESYWTATPWTTEGSPYSDSDSAYRVDTDGALNYSYVVNPYFAARPALYLRSDIAISVEGDEVESSLSDYTELELLEELYRRACK